jgi:putative Holliday junction resolvase
MIQQRGEASQASTVASVSHIALYFQPLRTKNNLPETDNSRTVNQDKGRSLPGRVLALDLGTKRVGVAVSDELRLSVRPLPALIRSNWKRLLLAVAELRERFDAGTVVIGLPLRLDGVEGDAARKARRIARNLGLSLDVAVHLQDERLTSRAAEESLRAEGYSADEISLRVDSEAAALILRDFLAQTKDKQGLAEE